MPTAKGLEILDNLKAKHFPNGYSSKSKSGKDYRFSRKGQMEYKRAARLQVLKHREAIL
ncbi:conserved hypothetical protein [Vibrio crassostreae]|uniref:hypothetical protein n=1 Tax=Vibrio TaxID=662 RepID=UPI00031D21FA|nr:MULTISPECIES: hypothetical protein [Vibrio]TCT58454.1 hypothetical protein EDB44_12074 [Vibrio crassostreae]TCT79982.1 hypothetical protein EDB43_12074 [Vibrio crassostreae]TCU01091.1 hypothetical protein EDB47_12046 [Vibrio crassostreae]CAK1753476.1 conserved hypothetical protein [Vibrio crassostreae]CAK1809578.1 conserved hypothetical protein [Vibrio crassostreae]